jgi:hypothetical protein
MSKKVLTKDCPSCEKMIIGDDSTFQCHWGNSKKPKILLDTKSKHGLKHCKLIRKEK